MDRVEQERCVHVVREAAEPVLRALAGGDPVDLDELAGLLDEVAAKVLQHIESDRGVDDVPQYAKQVARTTFIDWLRSKKRHRAHMQLPAHRDPLTSELTEELYSRTEMTPSSLVVHADDQRRHRPMIKAALDTLTQRERDVLHLRFVAHKPPTEVAELLGYKSAASVNSTVDRIRDKILAELSPSLRDPLERGRARR